jgi:hypothetical protein
VAENKTQPTRASVAAFLASVHDAVRRADAQALARMMQRASGEKAAMWGPAIVGYGSCHYVYDSGREGDMPLIAFSPRKAASVLYYVTGSDAAPALLARLGKYTVGKGCLYLKRLADVDAAVLERLLAAAVAARR